MRAFPRLANGPTRIPSEAGKARRVRVGVVSAQVHRHAGWRNRRGWFYALDEQEFELFLYALPGTFDDVSAFSYGAFEHIRDGVHSLASWMQQIRRDNLDILVYPEIGMSPLSHLLAAARLAPVQCMSFGHPETSGLPTMDYMLTSDLMEPANAQQYYREQIVRLPGTGFHRYPLDYVVEDQGRADFGLRETDTLFFYGHNIRKMMPEDDDYLAHIAALDATVRIVMVCDDPVDSAMIRERLAPAFRGCGVDVDDKLHIFGHLPTPSFVALIRSCDVYLDCPAWNGNNVAVDAFGQGLPPVAVEGAMMRQRHVYGLLARMGLRDLVAASKAEALTMGERLVRDPGYRRACADRVRAGYPNIFRETDCASAVAEFFRSLTPT
jgi:predicted O-linked N-acetylglucosamine transferase (SPINDLY family)